MKQFPGFFLWKPIFFFSFVIFLFSSFSGETAFLVGSAKLTVSDLPEEHWLFTVGLKGRVLDCKIRYCKAVLAY